MWLILFIFFNWFMFLSKINSKKKSLKFYSLFGFLPLRYPFLTILLWFFVIRSIHSTCKTKFQNHLQVWFWHFHWEDWWEVYCCPYALKHCSFLKIHVLLISTENQNYLPVEVVFIWFLFVCENPIKKNSPFSYNWDLFIEPI